MALLKTINIFLIFYISFFKKALLRALPALITKIKLINPNTEYKIKLILKQQLVNNIIKYLIK